MASDAISWVLIRSAILLYCPEKLELFRENFTRLGFNIAPPTPSSLQVLEAARASDPDDVELAGQYEYLNPPRDTLRTPPDDVDHEIAVLNTIASPPPPRKTKR